MDLVDALEQTYGQTEKVIANISDADLTKPTPCADWDVQTLLEHLVNVTLQFAALLLGEEPDWSAKPPLADRVGEWRAAALINLAAWRVPGAAETPSNMMPGMNMIDFNLCDAVVHTWDLAEATDQDPGLDPDVAEVVLDVWTQAPMDDAREVRRVRCRGRSVRQRPPARQAGRVARAQALSATPSATQSRSGGGTAALHRAHCRASDW